MKNFGLGLLLFIGFGGLAYWYFSPAQNRFDQYQRTPAQATKTKDQNFQDSSIIVSDPAEKNEAKIPQVALVDSREVAAQSVFEKDQNSPLKETSPIEIGNNLYAISENVYAVLKNDWDASDPAIIGEHMGHFLIESNTPISDGLPVFINQKSSRFAIVTKVLKVKFYDYNDRFDIFDTTYEVVQEYDHINVVFFKFNDLDSLLAANDLAKENQLVKRVNIEILEVARTER